MSLTYGNQDNSAFISWEHHLYLCWGVFFFPLLMGKNVVQIKLFHTAKSSNFWIIVL